MAWISASLQPASANALPAVWRGPWKLRCRLNSALSYLEGVKAVETRCYVSERHWTYSAVTISDRTLRFVKVRG